MGSVFLLFLLSCLSSRVTGKAIETEDNQLFVDSRACEEDQLCSSQLWFFGCNDEKGITAMCPCSCGARLKLEEKSNAGHGHLEELEEKSNAGHGHLEARAEQSGSHPFTLDSRSSLEVRKRGHRHPFQVTKRCTEEAWCADHILSITSYYGCDDDQGVMRNMCPCTCPDLANLQEKSDNTFAVEERGGEHHENDNHHLVEERGNAINAFEKQVAKRGQISTCVEQASCATTVSGFGCNDDKGIVTNMCPCSCARLKLEEKSQGHGHLEARAEQSDPYGVKLEEKSNAGHGHLEELEEKSCDEDQLCPSQLWFFGCNDEKGITAMCPCSCGARLKLEEKSQGHGHLEARAEQSDPYAVKLEKKSNAGHGHLEKVERAEQADPYAANFKKLEKRGADEDSLKRLKLRKRKRSTGAVQGEEVEKRVGHRHPFEVQKRAGHYIVSFDV